MSFRQVTLQPATHSTTPLPPSRKQILNNKRHAQRLQMIVLLPRPAKRNRHPRQVSERQRRAHLVAHGVKLRQHDPINRTRVPSRRQRLLKHGQLIHPVIPHERLADEQYQIGPRLRHQLGQRLHQGHVVLHPPGRIDEHDVVSVLGGLGNGGLGHCGGILGVALVVERYGEAGGVDGELFDGAGAEGVAGGEEGSALVALEVVGNFGEGCGFSDSCFLCEVEYKYNEKFARGEVRGKAKDK